jgi:hypothetical protein
MPDQPIGPILDGLGINIDLDPGDLIETAVVITKTIDADGRVSVGLYGSTGLDWLAQLGLITAASQVIHGPYRHPDDD